MSAFNKTMNAMLYWRSLLIKFNGLDCRIVMFDMKGAFPCNKNPPPPHPEVCRFWRTSVYNYRDAYTQSHAMTLITKRSDRIKMDSTVSYTALRRARNWLRRHARAKIGDVEWQWDESGDVPVLIYIIEPVILSGLSSSRRTKWIGINGRLPKSRLFKRAWNRPQWPGDSSP